MDDTKMKRPYISLRIRLILAVYLLVFVTTFICSWQSIHATQQKLIHNAYETAVNEQFRIGYTIKKMTESYYYSDYKLSLGYVSGFVRKSAESYAAFSSEDTCFRITNDANGTIYSNMPDEFILNMNLSPKTDGTISYVMKSFDNRNFIFVSSYIKIHQNLYRLDYVQDISNLNELGRNLSFKIAGTLFGAEIFLLVSLYILIGKMLSPLNTLKEQATAIACGDYTLRAKVLGNDEISQLAVNFNNMAEAVENHVKSLYEAAQLKEILASDLAHEIKTPITSIVAYSDYAAKYDISREDFHETLEYIKKEGQRIGDLSDKILKWNRLNYRDTLELRRCRPQRILDQLIYTLKPLMQLRNQSLSIENNTHSLYVDESLFISLLVNLCKNALNASQDGQTVRLNMDNDENQNLIIQVLDEGMGIAKEELKRITEPFYMIDKARDRAKGGAGLGLSLCTAIVSAHDGTLSIQSEPGKGTLVTVSIPGQ